MIHQCYKCQGLFQENEGAMLVAENSVFLSAPTPLSLYVFICKNCMNPEIKEKFEKMKQ